ncbi:hypothetical protein DI392_15970 [Vibrio albus]|uniref:Uncharacterized protein n=1 Tax=Vibrio albus TaxID=2200953 RepID=A0A2U3B5W8_9VIBR|nr:hypothetical protein [Vibrio albus]PWI32177.1 hypothetical protein DI392_15970 [Vibrio albus]
MGCIIKQIGSFLAVMLMIMSSVYAAKPINDEGMYLGNGFPSGEHFNLLFHGKKADHQCETYIEIATIVPLTGGDIEDAPYSVGEKFPVGECPASTEDYSFTCEYGNVVNMPRGSENIQVLMESGRSGPAKKTGDDSDLNNDALQVTDACTGYSGNDPAVVRLPGNKNGYAVYGRVLGKPTDDGSPDFSIDGRSIPIIGDMDENGDVVWLMGVISGDGVYLPDECGVDGCMLTRWDPETKGKGAKKATDLTGLFTFTGSVCYESSSDEACLDDGCTATEFCCTEVSDYELGDIEYNGTVYDCASLASIPDAVECPVDTLPLTLYCHEFTEDTWIFNIADFVNVLYSLSSDAYNVQFRFYPIK